MNARSPRACVQRNHLLPAGASVPRWANENPVRGPAQHDHEQLDVSRRCCVCEATLDCCEIPANAHTAGFGPERSARRESVGGGYCSRNRLTKASVATEILAAIGAGASMKSTEPAR